MMRTVGVAPGTITLSLGSAFGLADCPPDPVGWYPLSPFAASAPAPAQPSASVVATAAPDPQYLKIYGTDSKLSGFGDATADSGVRWDIVWKVGLGVLVAGLGVGFLATR